MANAKVYLKGGMGGSSCGKGRSEKTEVLKSASKKARRRAAKAEAKNDQTE